VPAGDALDEGAVDLQAVDGEAAQVAERGVAGAEVVQVYADPVAAQAGEQLGSAHRVLHERRLGQLQDQALGVQARVVQGLLDLVGEALLGELPAADVDADRDAVGRGQGTVQLGNLQAGLAQHPAADRVDEARLLGQGDELVGAHQAALRALPADERLKAHQAGVGQAHDGLVVHDELVALHGAAQAVLQAQPPHGPGVQGLVEDLGAGAAGLLGPVHRDVGLPQ